MNTIKYIGNALNEAFTDMLGFKNNDKHFNIFGVINQSIQSSVHTNSQDTNDIRL